MICKWIVRLSGTFPHRLLSWMIEDYETQMASWEADAVTCSPDLLNHTSMCLSLNAKPDSLEHLAQIKFSVKSGDYSNTEMICKHINHIFQYFFLDKFQFLFQSLHWLLRPVFWKCTQLEKLRICQPDRLCLCASNTFCHYKCQVLITEHTQKRFCMQQTEALLTTA